MKGNWEAKKCHLRKRWIVPSVGQTMHMWYESGRRGTLGHQTWPKKLHFYNKIQTTNYIIPLQDRRNLLQLKSIRCYVDPTPMRRCPCLFTFHMEFILAVPKLTLKKIHEPVLSQVPMLLQSSHFRYFY